MNRKYEILVDIPQNGNVIVTLTLGGNYYNDFRNFSLPSWEYYCKKNKIGLLLINRKIENDVDEYWQKFFIGTFIAKTKELQHVGNACFLDTDILISPIAQNIFDVFDTGSIAIVDFRHNHISPKEDPVLRNIAYFRQKYINSRYPLNSSLFFSIEEQYRIENLPVFSKLFCSGVFCFNIHAHAALLKEWGRNAKKIKKLTKKIDHGEQLYFNSCVFSWNKNIQWLNEGWQKIFLFEVGEKYPFLYKEVEDKKLFISCIQASLLSCNFLHFAGSWIEGQAWKEENIVDKEFIKICEDLEYYRNQKLPDLALGRLREDKL